MTEQEWFEGKVSYTVECGWSWFFPCIQDEVIELDEIHAPPEGRWYVVHENKFYKTREEIERKDNENV